MDIAPVILTVLSYIVVKLPFPLRVIYVACDVDMNFLWCIGRMHAMHIVSDHRTTRDEMVFYFSVSYALGRRRDRHSQIAMEKEVPQVTTGFRRFGRSYLCNYV